MTATATIAALERSESAGLRLWRRRGRTATPLMLLHGIGSRGQSFAALMTAVPNDVDVIAWDAPGYGGSRPLDNPTPAPRDYADALAGLLDQLPHGADRDPVRAPASAALDDLARRVGLGDHAVHPPDAGRADVEAGPGALASPLQALQPVILHEVVRPQRPAREVADELEDALAGRVHRAADRGGSHRPHPIWPIGPDGVRLPY